MKTGTKIALGVVAVLLLGIGLFIYGGMKMFGDEINAIRSLRQIEEGCDGIIRTLAQRSEKK